MEEIIIDEKTRQMLNDMIRTANELSQRAQLICTTYINSKGGEGEFRLTQDGSKLVKVVEMPKKEE